MNPWTAFRTLRHLRFEQMLYLGRRRVLERVVKPRARIVRLGSAPTVRWSPGERGFLSPLAGRDHGIVAEAVTKHGRFSFVGVERMVGWPPRWDSPSGDKLWDYNLHYFEWLWLLPLAEAREATLDWIARCPPTARTAGWEPYPVSLRLQNWATWFLGNHRTAMESDPEFFRLLADSMATQAQWLDRQLEFHLLGNHLLENAVALAVVGSALGGPPFDRLRSRGLALLCRELSEQILEDGLHFERSPMYHRRVVHALLILRDTGDPELADVARSRLPGMLSALSALTHPDGESALFNDSAAGIYPASDALIAHAHAHDDADVGPGRHHDGPFALPSAGYFGFHDHSDGFALMCDAGPIGPDQQPGHAHADVFSFELSLRGRRIVTDTGVWNYADAARRRIARSTAAHNTVEIAGADQAELWGSFRVGSRPVILDRHWDPSQDGTGFVLQARHDGYARRPGARALHQRRFEFDRNRARLKISDRVTAKRPVDAVARLHFHPDCIAEITGTDQCRVRLADAGGNAESSAPPVLRISVSGNDSLSLTRTPWYPCFHRERLRDCLEIRFTGSDRAVETVLEW